MIPVELTWFDWSLAFLVAVVKNVASRNAASTTGAICGASYGSVRTVSS